METAKIKEVCVCGTVLEVTGTNIFCLLRHEAFLTAHKVCREREKGRAEKSEREG